MFFTIKLRHSDSNGSYVEVNINYLPQIKCNLHQCQFQQKKFIVLAQEDFIESALKFRTPFATESWPKDLKSSMHFKFPTFTVKHCNEAINKFVNFSRDHDHRPLPRLNAENPIRFMPRRSILKDLKTKFPGKLCYSILS